MGPMWKNAANDTEASVSNGTTDSKNPNRDYRSKPNLAFIESNHRRVDGKGQDTTGNRTYNHLSEQCE